MRKTSFFIIIFVCSIIYSSNVFAKTANESDATLRIMTGFEEQWSTAYFSKDTVGVGVTGALLMVNGNFIKDANILIDSDRSLVPIRIVSEQLGANVNWDSKNREATIIKDGVTIKMESNNRIIQINNKIVQSEVAPKIVSDRIYIPLRVIAETMNCDVGYMPDMLYYYDGDLPIIWVEDKFDATTILSKAQAKLLVQNAMRKEIAINKDIDVKMNESQKIINGVQIKDGFGRFYFVTSKYYYNGTDKTAYGEGEIVFIDKYYGTIYQMSRLSSTSASYEIISGDDCHMIWVNFSG